MFASLAATLLFLVPVSAILLLRARRDTPLWEIALLVPAAVSVDLLSVLALALLVRLDVATLVTRALWIAATVAALALRPDLRAQVRWPRALSSRVCVAVAVAVAVALFFSLEVSRVYSIWDRRWHIPLVTSLRGQTAPFHNIYDPAQGLRYHFSGDVHAAMLQALSFSVIHSALALSLAHDIHFALTGIVLALLMSWWGYRRLGAFALAQGAVLLAGPLTMFREGIRSAQHGYSLINYLSLSFRPHISLSGLLALGFLTCVFVRLRTPTPTPVPVSTTAIPLVACAAGLALTDEASLGLLGLSLGAVWLVHPDVVHPDRKRGALIFAALLAAIVVPTLAFGGSFAPGGQRHVVSLVPWRSPGCYTPTLPLSELRGRLMLLYDVGPTLLVAGVGALYALTRRSATSRYPVPVFWLTLVLLSVLTLTRLDVDHAALEGHRFMTAALFLTPVLAIWALADGSPGPWRWTNAHPYGVAILGFGMLLGPLSTLDWLYTICPGWAPKYSHYFAQIDHYQVDCRATSGASLGARARPMYMDQPIWYLYSGCMPTFAAGQARGSKWELTIGQPEFGASAVAALRKWIGPNEPIHLACSVGPQRDALCAKAVAARACRPSGSDVQLCELAVAADRHGPLR